MDYQGYSPVYNNKSLIIKVAIISLLLLESCYSMRFTSDNMMKLKAGMTSNEVIQVFGKPMKTSGTTCGSATDKPWQCIIWYYGEYSPYLVFSQESNGDLYLNSWQK